MSNETLWRLVLVLTATVVFGAVASVGVWRTAHADLDRSYERIGKCIDMVHEAREGEILSEEAWLRATEDLSVCQMWEPRLQNMCLGPEYYSSFSPFIGP